MNIDLPHILCFLLLLVKEGSSAAMCVLSSSEYKRIIIGSFPPEKGRVG